MAKKDERFCISCALVLHSDHIGIKCIQDHDICEECSKHFVSSVFEEPLSMIPVKCAQCSQEIPSLIFERQLDADQLQIYQLYILQSKLDSNERTQGCPHCKYFEIWLKESSSNFFYCKNPKCKKLTCVYCYRDVQLPKTSQHSDYLDLETLMMGELYLDDNEEEYESSLSIQEGVFHHFRCGELKTIKQKIEKVLEKGTKRRCPCCKLAGRKDTACTHMTCPKCATIWCYFCGMDVKELVNVAHGENIYDHNAGWQHFEGRCPMYFNEIFEVDDRWPEDDEECLDRFHHILTKKLFKRKVEKLGAENLKLALSQFPGVKNSIPDEGSLNDQDDVVKPFIVRLSREEYEELIN